MPTPTHPRTATASLCSLSFAAGTLLTLTGCDSHATPEHPQVGAANPLLVQDGNQTATADPLGVFQQPDLSTDPTPAPTLPEIAFQEISEGLPHSGTWIGYPLLYDFNGDKHADLVASNREEDGFSTWMAPAQHGQPWKRCIEGLARDMGYGPARAADFDSDGIPDLVLSAHSDAIRLYLNDGKMNWKRTEKPIDNPFLVLDVAVGNLNGDAFPDVVGIGHFKGGLGVYLGDGKGGLQRQVTEGLPGESVFGRDVEVGDLDGNGLDDIVVSTSAGLKVFLTQPGDKPHWKEISKGLPNPAIGNSIMSVCIGRFTADSAPQIATCSIPDTSVEQAGRDSIGVYAFRADKQTWEHIDSGLPRGERYRDLRAADINGDGKLDLLAMSLEQGGAIYLGDGNGHFTAKGRLPGVHGKGRIAFGDIDGDGLVDIALSVPAQKENPEGGGVRAFLNRRDLWK